MPVDSKHPDYAAMFERWERCRDTFEGGDAVKAKGVAYLPILDVHLKRGEWEKYEAYKKRALFFNAFARTVNGLAGSVFQKAPTVGGVPKDFEPHIEDITLSDEPLEQYALNALTEVLTVGRHGVQVEMASEGERPYWCHWRAEDIITWRTMRISGEYKLVLVVLKESRESRKDEYSVDYETTYRVLRLVGEGDSLQYVEEVWVKKKETDSGGLGGEWMKEDEAFPERKGERLDFIPFVFLGPLRLTADVQKPPLIDLADVNLSHFRNSADYEHGLHYTGIPIPWIAGGTSKNELIVGPSHAVTLEKGGQFGIAQADGNMLGALENSLERKQKMMASLGARLLEQSPNVPETATAISMRHGSEHATLKTIAQTVERGLTLALRWHIWWAGVDLKERAEKKVVVELNKDFLAKRLDPQEMQALVGMLQAESISYETFYYNLQAGEIARPGVSSEEEKKQIELEKPEDVAPEGQPTDGNDTIVVPGEPWQIVEREGAFVVVETKTNTDAASFPFTDETRSSALVEAKRKMKSMVEGSGGASEE